GGGDYSGLALRPTTGDLIIASASTDRIFGAAPLAESGFGEPEVIIDDTTAPPIHSTAPTALAFDSAEWLYVGFAGEDSSGIVRIDPETSFAEAVVTTDSPVTGIAFRPSDESLFFTVLGEVGSESGAVVTIGTNGLASEFARRLPSPTALAFDSDDGLYVTVLGTSPNGTAGQVQYLHVEEAAEEEDPATSDADDGS
ncbi:MAG: hypothetical protein GY842_18210, partial [bacterium]|nr:hypothetical protein [bacterium]